MIRQSAKRTWTQVKDNRWRYTDDYGNNEVFGDQKCSEMCSYLDSSEAFVELRCNMLMTVVPKRIHKKDQHQAAFVGAAISRVNILLF